LNDDGASNGTGLLGDGAPELRESDLVKSIADLSEANGSENA
jgi:hypothetical protein